MRRSCSGSNSSEDKTSAVSAAVFRFACALSFSISICLAACNSVASSPGAGATTATDDVTQLSITVPYTASSAAFAAIWVAADQNFFSKHGIQAQVQYMDANAAAAALVSGQIPFCSSPAILGPMLSDPDLVLVAKLVSQPSFSLYATSEVQRVEDLKGKIIADTQRGTAPDNALRDLLARHGLSENDVQIVYTPNPSAAAAAMMTGQTSAAILAAPVTLAARNAGYAQIGDTVAEGIPGLAAVISTQRSRLTADPVSVRAFLSALKEATDFMAVNPDATEAIIGKYTQTDAQADLAETYRVFEPTWIVGAVDPGDVAAALHYSSDPKAATADPLTYIDSSIVRALH